MNKRLLSALVALSLFATTAYSQDNPRWLRHSAISPDGKTVAFAYQGDIFTVSAAGGEARQVTTSAAYESDPLWSADGKRLVFSSYREGSKDGTVTVRAGGRSFRLTRAQAAAPEVLARIESNHAMTREYRRAHKEEFIPLRNIASPHVWVAPEGIAPAPGDRITVLYRDRRMRFRRSLRF